MSDNETVPTQLILQNKLQGRSFDNWSPTDVVVAVISAIPAGCSRNAALNCSATLTPSPLIGRLANANHGARELVSACRRSENYAYYDVTTSSELEDKSGDAARHSTTRNDTVRHRTSDAALCREVDRQSFHDQTSSPRSVASAPPSQ